ncbi:MAG: four helix bundle protein [Verrucomicrobiales bacterium]|nr:four helix bundle protein [Verrucomicrobiales bacterium]
MERRTKGTSISFEDLRVYRLAEQVADTAWNITSGWDPFSRDTVGRQLVRSADSIGANIAEGFGRGSYQDNRRFVRISRGSLFETRHWLRRAFRRRLLNNSQVQEMKSLLDLLGPSLNAYLRSIGSRPNSAASKEGSPPGTPTQGRMTNDQ